MIRALLAGSRVNWRNKLDPLLAEHGIQVDWWWETRTQVLEAIPSGCELVLITTDCNAHTVSEPVAARARKSETKLLYITHRRSQTIPVLIHAGFPNQYPRIPATAPTSTQEPPMADLPLTVVHGSKSYSLRNLDKTRYAEMLPVVAKDPLITSAAMAASMGVNPTVVDHFLAAIRQTLGITLGRVADLPRYLAVCTALGVEPAVPTVIEVPELAVLPLSIPRVTGATLFQYRRHASISQLVLANRLGVSQTSISKAEKQPNTTVNAEISRSVRALVDQGRLGMVKESLINMGLPWEESDLAVAATGAQKAPEAASTGSGTVTLTTGFTQPTAPAIVQPLHFGPHISTPLADVRTALLLLREAMRAEQVETVIINLSAEPLKIDDVPAGGVVVTRRVLVSEAVVLD